MHTNGDVLGEEGRKALDACVKVKIYGAESSRRYERETALSRLQDCYAGRCPEGPWLNTRELLLPTELGVEKTYDIIEIHDALERVDKTAYVEKYPKPGPRYEEVKGLIDKRRIDVDIEWKEANANPGAKHQYSWIVAQRRVRDCFSGNFAGDVGLLKSSLQRADILPIKNNGNRLPINTQTFTIWDIHEAIEYYDGKKCFKEYPENGGPGSDELKKIIEENRAAVKKECKKAKLKFQRYSANDAEQRVRECFTKRLNEEAAIFPIKNVEIGVQDINQTYDIFDIYKTYLHFGHRCLFVVDPELIEPFTARSDALEEEYQTSKKRLVGCSESEAERRVRDCFAVSLEEDTDIFPTKEEESRIPKTQQTYDIFDIKNAVNYFDQKVLLEKYLDGKQPDSKKKNSQVDEKRAKIKEEYVEATKEVPVEHGSGFIIHEHFIITNKHVVEDVERDNTMRIGISNVAIGELRCKVADSDGGKDLALLFCEDLNLKQSGISPLQFSNQPLLPGMQIFAFGFPMSHTEETALFVSGHVSGSKKMLSGHSMIVLNCSLNSGNSGGPVLCWVSGQLKVVGVAAQKHFKQILTLEERMEIEKIWKSLQTSSIAESKYLEGYQQEESNQTKMNLLTLELYDALETHSQFNLSNAVPGHCMVEFVKEVLRKYSGEGREELAEVVQWSEDHVNVLPSGNHSASECCVQ